MVRVVLCNVRACESWDEEVKVDGCGVGVLSICAIRRDVSVAPAFMG
jgi:hypothetical protein